MQNDLIRLTWCQFAPSKDGREIGCKPENSSRRLAKGSDIQETVREERGLEAEDRRSPSLCSQDFSHYRILALKCE